MKKGLAVLLIFAMLASTAIAESWTVFVVDFDFLNAEVILEDEDGFQWRCPFGESDWELGEEYQLIFTEDGIEILEIE